MRHSLHSDNTVHQISLWFYGGRSDKVYHAQIVNVRGRYEVVCHWGRRGGTLQSQVKGSFASHWSAAVCFNSIVGEKIAKGYEVTSRVGHFSCDHALA